MPNTPDIEAKNLIQSILTETKLETNHSNDSNHSLNKSNDKSSDSVPTTPSVNNSILYDDDEDNIYDTVAPDEPPAAPTHSNDSQKAIADHFDTHSSTDNLSAKYYDLNSYANYVNIDYFLRKDETSSRDDSDDNETQVSQSLSSDHEIDDSVSHLELIKLNSGPNDLHSLSSSSLDRKDSIIAPTYDEVFEDSLESEVKSNPMDAKVLLICLLLFTYLTKSHRWQTSTPNSKTNLLEAERLITHKCIIANIAESEAIYVDCLSTLIQVRTVCPLHQFNSDYIHFSIWKP